MRHALWRSGFIAALGLLSATANAVPAEPPRYQVQLRVVGEDWGGASPTDIRAVLRSAAAELARRFPERPSDDVRVSFSTEGPIVLFERGPAGEHQVQLNVQGNYWAQFAFQFAHEHCHIVCGYRRGSKANKWFEESLCELASLYVLRRMSETWRTDPPYPNWKSFHSALADYADKRLKDARLPEEKTLAAWYADHAADLRGNNTQREKNLVVAAALLPLFEAEPEHWPAVEHLNTGLGDDQQTFAAFLSAWRKNVPERHRPFVEKVAKQLGVGLPAE